MTWPRGLEIGCADLDSRLLADVGKTAAVVPQEAQNEPLKWAWRPISPADAGELKPLDLIDLGRPVDVIADEQVKIAIVVDIQERRPRQPAVGSLGIGRLGDVFEMPLPSLRKR